MYWININIYPIWCHQPSDTGVYVDFIASSILEKVCAAFFFSFSFKNETYSKIRMHLQFTIIVNRQSSMISKTSAATVNITNRYKNWMKEIINAQHLKLKSQNYSKWYANEYFSLESPNHRKHFVVTHKRETLNVERKTWIVR